MNELITHFFFDKCCQPLRDGISGYRYFPLFISCLWFSHKAVKGFLKSLARHMKPRKQFHMSGSIRKCGTSLIEPRFGLLFVVFSIKIFHTAESSRKGASAIQLSWNRLVGLFALIVLVLYSRDSFCGDAPQQ